MKKKYLKPHMVTEDLTSFDMLCLSYTPIEEADDDDLELNNDVKEDFGNIGNTNLWDEEW